MGSSRPVDVELIVEYGFKLVGATVTYWLMDDGTWTSREELERQYGGQAEVAAKVGLGELQQLKNSWRDFLEQIGAQLIELGMMIIAFKMTLKSLLANPWAAIAIGAAMGAAATVMTALINKNARKNVPKLAKGGLAYGSTYARVGITPTLVSTLR